MENIKVLKIEQKLNEDILYYEENNTLKNVKLPIKIGERYIHYYNNSEVGLFLFSIGLIESEILIDEEECGNIPLKEYQAILSKYNAKIYKHQFVYGEDDVKDVEDSYFENIHDTIKCAKYLNTL